MLGRMVADWARDGASERAAWVDLEMEGVETEMKVALCL